MDPDAEKFAAWLERYRQQPAPAPLDAEPGDARHFPPDAFPSLDAFDAYCVPFRHTRGAPRPAYRMGPDLAAAMLAPVAFGDDAAWVWDAEWEEARFDGDFEVRFVVLGRTRTGWAVATALTGGRPTVPASR
ncbi:MAG: hypothetical protein R3F59_34055 [Myxococcota bacterium]